MEKTSAAEQPLLAWFADARHADWKSPADIKRAHRTASVIANNRVVFNIKGNDDRLIVAVHYAFGIVYVRFIGTHAAYDRVDAATI